MTAWLVMVTKTIQVSSQHRLPLYSNCDRNNICQAAVSYVQTDVTLIIYWEKRLLFHISEAILLPTAFKNSPIPRGLVICYAIRMPLTVSLSAPDKCCYSIRKPLVVWRQAGNMVSFLLAGNTLLFFSGLMRISKKTVGFSLFPFLFHIVAMNWGLWSDTSSHHDSPTHHRHPNPQRRN